MSWLQLFISHGETSVMCLNFYADPMADLASVFMLCMDILGHPIKLHLNSVSFKFSQVKDKHVALDTWLARMRCGINSTI